MMNPVAARLVTAPKPIPRTPDSVKTAAPGEPAQAHDRRRTPPRHQGQSQGHGQDDPEDIVAGNPQTPSFIIAEAAADPNPQDHQHRQFHGGDGPVGLVQGTPSPG